VRKKKAPAGAGAKLREETPRKGCDVANRVFAIPRCNNMLVCKRVSKTKNNIIFDSARNKTPFSCKYMEQNGV
jgi:hypothetical protein